MSNYTSSNISLYISTNMRSHLSLTVRNFAVAVVCGLLLLAVLSLYMQPQFLRTLADQLWGCF
jgi:multisubunit Na+/H+ antiporter MnhB subunit